MVQSSEEIPAVFHSSFEPRHFAHVVRHDGSGEQTAAQLERLGVRHVLAGCELGVPLADELSERLQLPSNGTRLTQARRNKYAMAQAVARHGLRTAAQYRARSLDALLAWARQHAAWPVIVKPVHGSSSDGVCLCGSELEIKQAFEAVIGERNVLGLVNREVLIQEFLQGSEYVVDTVSWGGRHQIAAFWKYGKPASRTPFVCYDSMELLPCEGEIQDRLLAYVTGVLDAVGIRYGPAHSEVIMVDGAPVLVETGARLHAGMNALMGRVCGDRCPLDLTIETCLCPDHFLAGLGRPYRLSKSAVVCFLMPAGSGTLKALRGLEEIEQLLSFFDMQVGAADGQPVPRVAGVVTLIHPDPAVLDQDLRRIRHLEQNGLYEIEP